jgi:4-amino-4-deoxy-L-arabinose transferase-like glycosyltransferase
VFSSGTAAILTYVIISQLPFSSLIQLIVGIIIFVIIILPLAVITRTLNKADLINIRQIVNALGPLRKPLAFVVNIIEKLMDIFHNK